MEDEGVIEIEMNEHKIELILELLNFHSFECIKCKFICDFFSEEIAGTETYRWQTYRLNSIYTFSCDLSDKEYELKELLK